MSVIWFALLMSSLFYVGVTFYSFYQLNIFYPKFKLYDKKESNSNVHLLVLRSYME